MPCAPCRSYYIMCMMAITFLNLIGIPMEIAFLDGHSGLAWEGFNVFSDTLFLIDVALNFRMGIITEDCEVRTAPALFSDAICETIIPAPTRTYSPSLPHL